MSKERYFYLHFIRNLPENKLRDFQLKGQFTISTAMKLNRKDFLKSIAVGIAGAVINPFTAKSQTKSEDEKTIMEQKNIILKIKPLGFTWETADPFLFCVHHEDKFPKGKPDMSPVTSMNGRNLGDDFIIKDGFRMYHGTRVPGFPGHPHRGFETITVVREGLVDHADSMGASGRYGDGDVQWMTAGKGVQHSEMFPLIHTERENPMELFQIWLNLPARNKMVQPHFKMLWRDAIPVLTQKDNAGKETKVELIAGYFQNTMAPTPPPDSWAADPKNEVAIGNLRMDPNAIFTLPKASAGVNRTIYFYGGENLTIAGTTIPPYSGVEVLADVELVIANGNSPASILVLQGRPIGEPVIQYGPFVMNTKEEIHQAFDDFHATQFGGWPWPVQDQVHDRNQGRFAKHSDGKLEEKS